MELHQKRKRMIILQVRLDIFQPKFFVERTEANEINRIFNFIFTKVAQYLQGIFVGISI